MVLGGEDMVDNDALIPVLETLASGTGFQLYLDQDWPPAVADEVLASVARPVRRRSQPQDVVDRINEAWST